MTTNGSKYIRLAVGQPQEVQIAGDGVASTSPNGSPQVEFPLMDGRTLCATPFQAGKINRVKFLPGDWLRLAMNTVDGKSLTAVERIASAPPRPVATPAAAEPQRPTGPRPAAAQHHTAQSHGITPIRERAATMTQLGEVLVNGLPHDPDDPGPAALNGHSSGNGHKPSPTPAAASLMRGDVQNILRYYTEAVDLAVAVKKYATLNGLDLGPASFEDIRCIAATSRIGEQRNGGSH